jgi:hypothetical protein
MLPFGYRPTPSSSRATSLWLYVWTGRSGDEFTVIFRSVSQVTRSTRILKVTELKPDCSPLARPITVPRRQLNCSMALGALDMHVCYFPSDIDAERCRISLREKSAVSLITLDIDGRVASLTGVVQSIQFDPNRATGMPWRVEMDLSAVTSTPQTPKVRQ